MDFSCCQNLSDAITKTPNSLFRFEENGVCYLAVGYMQTEEGTGWFEQALIFCPFCGKQLQDEEEIKQQANQIQ
jgi:hypothetical protein